MEYSQPTTAIFDPANNLWQFVDYPEDEFSKVDYPINGSVVDATWDRGIELFDDSIFLSFAEQIHKYDSQPSHRIFKKSAGTICLALPHGRDE
jgi:hypothetical protein